VLPFTLRGSRSIILDDRFIYIIAHYIILF